MSNPSGPDQGNGPVAESADEAADVESANEETAEQPPEPETPSDGEEAATEVMTVDPATTPEPPAAVKGERRFTAPSGFDVGSTQQIDRPAEPATEVLSAVADTEPVSKPAAPQIIPPRGDVPKPPRRSRSWGWVVALLLVIAALVAVAILGTVLLTRNAEPKVSQEDMVRSTIQNFDVAVQNGDLATLRSITCGATRDSYVNYNDRAWADTHARVAAAKQYPVVASIDQVVVNGEHAEANVTTFMAYAPQTRSTRSFDLQFRDDQWKICQAPTS
jgi:hypothetical protein